MTSQPHWYLDASEATRRRIKDRTERAMAAELERMIQETRRRLAEDGPRFDPPPIGDGYSPAWRRARGYWD